MIRYKAKTKTDTQTHKIATHDLYKQFTKQLTFKAIE